MNIDKVLKQVDFSVAVSEVREIKKECNELIKELKAILKKQKIKADIFVGGSFAKGTIVRSNKQDIDIFVRFDSKYDNISEILEKIVSKIKGYKTEKVHGSRDYFRLAGKDEIEFEIVPVIKVKSPKEARNITDLSYFHVNYVKNKLNGKIAREVVLAKAFCKALEVYGAESYINGFSGYALECLIIYYKSLGKMLRELSKAKDKVIIDSAKFYKKKSDIMISLNESRLQSPIVLVDPTWKERNVLAALNNESFEKFKVGALRFLKSPKAEFFTPKQFDASAFKRKAGKNEFLHLVLSTDKQPGDIAGTKLKNFSKFIITQMEKFFDVVDYKFEYGDGKDASLFVIAKAKREILRKGPPVSMTDACISFKKANKNVFEKSGVLYAKIVLGWNAKSYLMNWIKKYSGTIKQMDVNDIKIN